MTREINFLSERRKLVTKQELRDKWLLKIGVAVLIGVFVLFLMSFGTYLYLAQKLTQIKANETTARSQIKDSQQTESDYVIFSHKLGSLGQLYQDREDKNSTITYINTLFDQSVLIKSLEYDPKEKVLIFKLESVDVFALRKVLEAINSDAVTQKFKSVNPSGLLRNDAGQYEIQLTVSTATKL